MKVQFTVHCRDSGLFISAPVEYDKEALKRFEKSMRNLKNLDSLSFTGAENSKVFINPENIIAVEITTNK